MCLEFDGFKVDETRRETPKTEENLASHYLIIILVNATCGNDMCYCFLSQILETDFAIALFVIILLKAQPNRMILPAKKPITDLGAGTRRRACCILCLTLK